MKQRVYPYSRIVEASPSIDAGICSSYLDPISSAEVEEVRQAIYDALRLWAPESVAMLVAQREAGMIPLEASERWNHQHLRLKSFEFDVWASCRYAELFGTDFKLMPGGRAIRLQAEAMQRNSGSAWEDASAHPPAAICNRASKKKSIGPAMLGEAEISVDLRWRFFPTTASADKGEIRKAILNQFIEGLDRELDVIYSRGAASRPKIRPRQNLERDATRLVLRYTLKATLDQIVDFEAGYILTLENGLTIEKEQSADGNEYPEASADSVEKSIRNLARAAGVTPQKFKVGRPSKPETDDDPIYRDFLT